MKQRWEAEKDADPGDPRHASRARGARRSRSSRPSARPTTSAAAELKYGTLRELQERLAEQEAALAALQGPDATLLKEEVDRRRHRRDRRRSGRASPSRGCMEGEMAKLVHMEERLHERVVGQDEAIAAVSRRRPPRARRASRTRAGRSARSCSSAPPASARPSSRAPSPSSCSTTSRR